MATWPEVVPPVAAILAIGWLEGTFPESRIEHTVGLFKGSVPDPDRFTNLKWAVNHLALGWQTTVDLIYTLLASLTLLVSRALERDLQPERPVFWTLVGLFLVNVALLVWCATLGPEDVVAAPYRFPVFQCSISLRWICFLFVIAANVITIIAVCSEICFFPAVLK